MARLSALMILFVLSALPGTTAPVESPGGPPSICTFPISRTVRIPVAIKRAGEAEQAAETDAALLWVTSGAKDELPEGPSGFDVLEDGSFVIADPLRHRLAIFDSKAKFLQEWKLGFAADSVSIAANELILVEEASTGTLHVLDRSGRLQPDAYAVLPQRGEASVLTPRNGAVARIGRDGQNRGPIEVRFDRPGQALLSLESLATDPAGNSFIALESTVEGKASPDVNVDKVVRKYDSEAVLVGETSTLPLDYFVTPVDELRVHVGFVYQLQTTKSEVRINIWNTNEGCSHP